MATSVASNPYLADGACQTTADNRILLYNYYSANVDYDLTIYVRLRQTVSAIAFTSRLYSDNGELQYIQTYSQTVSKVNPSLDPYPLTTFTENAYTIYYF